MQQPVRVTHRIRYSDMQKTQTLSALLAPFFIVLFLTCSNGYCESAVFLEKVTGAIPLENFNLIVQDVVFTKCSGGNYCAELTITSSHINITQDKYNRKIIVHLNPKIFIPEGVNRVEKLYYCKLSVPSFPQKNFHIYIRIGDTKYIARVRAVTAHASPAPTPIPLAEAKTGESSDVDLEDSNGALEKSTSSNINQTIEKNLSTLIQLIANSVTANTNDNLHSLNVKLSKLLEERGVSPTPPPAIYQSYALTIFVFPILISFFTATFAIYIQSASGRKRISRYTNTILGRIGRSRVMLNALRTQAERCLQDIEYGLTDRIGFKGKGDSKRLFISPTFDSGKYEDFLKIIINSGAQDESVAASFYLIIGKAGQGKTTTLKRLCLDLTEIYCSDPGHSDTDRSKTPFASRGGVRHLLPIFISLKLLEGYISIRSPRHLAECIQNYVIEKIFGFGQKAPVEIAEYWFSGRRLLLLFDGIDEIKPKNRKRIIQAINELYETCEVSVIITSRPIVEAFDIDLYYCRTIKIDNCESNEIDGYIYSSYFIDDPAKNGETFLEKYSEHPGVVELLQSPFHVSMLLFLYYENDIAGLEMEMDFYAKTIEKLNSIRKKIIDDLLEIDESTLQLQDLYIDLAYSFHENDLVEQNLISPDLVSEVMNKYKHKDITESLFTKTLCDHSGVIGRCDGKIEFVHKSLLEYFLGLAFAKHFSKFDISNLDNGELLTVAKSFFSVLSDDEKEYIISMQPDQNDSSDLGLTDILPYAYIRNFDWKDSLKDKKIWNIRRIKPTSTEHIAVLGDMLMNVNNEHLTEGILEVIGKVSMDDDKSDDLRQAALETYFRFALYNEADQILMNYEKVDQFIIALNQENLTIACKAIASLRLGGIYYLQDYIDRAITKFVTNYDKLVEYRQYTTDKAQEDLKRAFHVIRTLQEIIIQYNVHTSTLYIERLLENIRSLADKDKKLHNVEDFLKLLKQVRLIKGIQKYCNTVETDAIFDEIVAIMPKVISIQDNLYDQIPFFFMVPRSILENHTNNPEYYTKRFDALFNFMKNEMTEEGETESK